MDSRKKADRNHETWLKNFKGQTLRIYATAWKYFTEFLGDKDEAWLLEHKDEDWGSHLIEFHRFLKQKPKGKGKGLLSDNSCNLFANGIRSYFQHIGIGLGLDRTQKREISKVESMPMKDYPFDLATKAKLLAVATAKEEYILSTGISLGLRISDFMQLKRGQLEPLLDKEVPIPLGELITKKEGVKAYPFLDNDAVYAIRRYLSELDREGRKEPEEKMLLESEFQVNDLLEGLFKKANIPLGSYRVRFHILRKFISDSLASVSSGDKWKWFVGKSATSPYVSHEGREVYKNVLRLTQVNGSAKVKGIDQNQIDQLHQKLDDMNYELGRTSELLELVIENVLTAEQKALLKKLSKQHFGDEYPTK